MQSSHDSDPIIRKDTCTDSEIGCACLKSIVFDRGSWSKSALSTSKNDYDYNYRVTRDREDDVSSILKLWIVQFW